MKTIESKLIITAALFLIMLFTGGILKKKGKPYPMFLLSIHKICSLLGAVGVVLSVIQLYKGIDASFLFWILIVVSGIVFLLSFSSGTILTIEKKGKAYSPASQEEPMKNMHKVAPVVATLLIAVTLVLMYWNKF